MSVSTSFGSKGSDGSEGPAGSEAEGPISGTIGTLAVLDDVAPEEFELTDIGSSSGSICSARSSCPGGGLSLFNSSLSCSRWR